VRVRNIWGRVAVGAACLAVAAGATACGSSDNGGSGGSGGGSGSSGSGGDKGTIAFLLSGPDLYYQYGLKGAEAAAEKLGYKVKVYPNPNVSPSVELANVQNAIASGAVAIDGYSVGLSTETATIDKASAAGVPIFLMYGYSPDYINKKGVIGFEQVPLVHYGQGPGSYLKQHLTSGDTVGVITGQLGRGDAEGYREGFLKGLGCSGDTAKGNPPMDCANGVKYVTTETGKWLRPAAFSAAQDLIGKYPDLSALYVENDDMAVGVHTALVHAHKNVKLVTSNGAPYGLAGIKAGWISASSTCSPSLEGLNSVRLIDAYLNKKIQGGKLYDSYNVMVDKGSVDKAVGWTFFKDPSQVDHWMNAPLLKPAAAPAS
jgi:ABC-type sugar transport system substrate-binding protein